MSDTENDTSVVGTTAGFVRGTTITTPYGPTRRWAGIPYGAPPVGEKRFRAATPAEPWTGVLDTDRFGPNPIQATSGPFSGVVPGMEVTEISEDCLNLNVWSPAAATASSALPVMVWVYGGAFVTGGTSMETYDAARLAAEQEIVVVTFNYRMGALGFLDLRTIDGGETTDVNCGLRDQLLALKWVSENVAHFGGDAQRVTVFGESAGAGSIMHLLTTDGIGALVRGAIVQSPGIDLTIHGDTSARVAQVFVEKAGAVTVAELRALTPEQILETQQIVSARLLFDVGTMVFHPVVDGTLVPATPSVALASGAASDVSLLVGYTADELRLFPDPRADDLDREGMAAWARSFLHARMARDPGIDVAGELVDHYTAAAVNTSRPAGSDAWGALTTDGNMRQPVIRVADSRPADAPTFVYQFDWQARHAARDIGAFHAIDLPFTFDTFGAGGWSDFLGVDDDARRLGSAMRSAWSAFAATGDPSTAALGPWPRYDAASRSTMVLDSVSAVVTDPLREQREWWDGLWDPNCRPAGVPH